MNQNNIFEVPPFKYPGYNIFVRSMYSSTFNTLPIITGDYREGLPSYSKVTELQLTRAKMLLDKGVELGYLQKDYHVVGAKDVQSSLSPGTNLYRAIQQWPNYSHNNDYRGKTCLEIHNSSQNQTKPVEVQTSTGVPTTGEVQSTGDVQTTATIQTGDVHTTTDVQTIAGIQTTADIKTTDDKQSTADIQMTTLPSLKTLKAPTGNQTIET